MPDTRLSLRLPSLAPSRLRTRLPRRLAATGALLAILLPVLAWSPPAVQAGRFPSQDLSPVPEAPTLPPCTCRAQGRVFQMGETVCLETADGPRPALCVMDQNVTSWRRMPGICPSARAGGRVL
jgi:hypothetical protein